MMPEAVDNGGIRTDYYYYCTEYYMVPGLEIKTLASLDDSHTYDTVLHIKMFGPTSDLTVSVCSKTGAISKPIIPAEKTTTIDT